MKTKAASLLVVILLTTTQCMAQKKVTVEAKSYDISNNLDLQAVASIFGESDDLEEFEMKLNDYDSQISNLDMNDDGEVDYLRVIETSENNVHLVVIQAVLGRNDFQDVATIVVERKANRRTYVQIIGDPYMYGYNYIIEPVYYYTPSIYSFFWSSRYHRWHSPYYWGYYPHYYHNRRPYDVNIYIGHINRHINHDHRYYYSNSRRTSDVDRLYNSVSRNDYSKRYPERTFTSRNQNVPNKQALDRSRNDSRSLQSRTPGANSESVRRNNSAEPRSGVSNSRLGNSQSGNENRAGTISRETEKNAPAPTRSDEYNSRKPENRTSVDNNRETNSRQNSTNAEPKRENRSGGNSEPARIERSTPAASQPARRTESKSVERKSSEPARSATRSNESRSSGSSGNRR